MPCRVGVADKQADTTRRRATVQPGLIIIATSMMASVLDFSGQVAGSAQMHRCKQHSKEAARSRLGRRKGQGNPRLPML